MGTRWTGQVWASAQGGELQAFQIHPLPRFQVAESVSRTDNLTALFLPKSIQKPLTNLGRLFIKELTNPPEQDSH